MTPKYQTHPPPDTVIPGLYRQRDPGPSARWLDGTARDGFVASLVRADDLRDPLPPAAMARATDPSAERPVFRFPMEIVTPRRPADIILPMRVRFG